jgi:hypothetical protein
MGGGLWEIWKAYRNCLKKKQKGWNDLEGTGVDCRTILIRILNKQDCMMWNGFIWLRTENSGWLLCGRL